MEAEHRRRPWQALTHPGWLVALAALVLNDHLFKGAGILPGWLTGKLSDLAGLVVAPALVAVLLGARTRRGLALAHAAVGLVFAAINVSPVAAGALESLTALGPLPWHIVVDPTDLIALPALALSWMILDGWRPIASVLLSRAAFGAGVLACMATSPPDPGPDNYTFRMDMTANIAIANRSGHEVLVRVRSLRQTMVLDCAAVAADPVGTLSREAFGPAVTWALADDQAFSLTDDLVWGYGTWRECAAWIIDGPGLPERLVWILTSEYPETSLPSTASTASAVRTIFVDTAGDGLEFSAHPALSEAPEQVPPSQPPTCSAAAELGGVAWSKPLPAGGGILLDVQTSPDGCSRLDLGFSTGGLKARWYVCHPGVELPFVVGEALDVRDAKSGGPPGIVEAVRVASDAWTMVLGRGTGLPVTLSGVTLEVTPSGACGVVSGDCGASMIAHDVALADAGEGTSGLAPRTLVLHGGGTVHVVRAASAIVADTACEGSLVAPGLTVETVVSVPAGDVDAGSTDGGSDAGSTDGGSDAGSTDGGAHDGGEVEDGADAGGADDGAGGDDGAGVDDGGAADGGADDGNAAGAVDAGEDGGPNDTEADDANG